MAFQRFVQKGRGYSPKISIWTRGQIGFNRGAVKKLGVQNYGYAVLFYDPDRSAIGIKLTNDQQEEGATKIIKGKTGAFISAKAFVDYYDIPHQKTKKYDVAYDEEDEMYIVQL